MCDTLVVVGPDGILFAKNSDRDPNEAQMLEWRPPRTHAQGSRLRCTWVEVPQARRTHGVLLSRPFWMWGAEMGANEHGVVIGNEAVFTRRRVEKTGLTGMDLVRLGLERGETAREAVEVMVELLETHGQGGRCGHEDRAFRYHSSFLVADRRGAVVLETAGREWATEEVTGGARTLSNALSIRGFAERHSDRLKTWACEARTRQARTAAEAAGARGVRDLMALLRDHGPSGEPDYRWLNGAMAAPCMHAGGRLAAAQTTASWVSSLGPDRVAHWVTATAAPCTGLFRPVRVGQPLDLGPSPTDRFDERAPWWRHERLHRRVARDPGRLLPLFAGERDRLEESWVARPPEPAAAFAEAEARRAEWTARVASSEVRDVRPRHVRDYWRVRDRRGGLSLDRRR